ncbi:MAG: tyrosine-type recombinase/integrase [Burkholderiales bacterium]
MRDYRMIFGNDYFSIWKRRPVESITRREVLERYKLLCSQHGIGMANRAMRTLSSAFNYGKATITSLENWSNPVMVLGETRSRRQLKPRTGHIPLATLPQWLNALNAYVEGARYHEERRRFEDIQLLLILILMTGLRSTEARSLEWTDVDTSKGTITIRGDVAKNGREALLPLNRWLADLLANRYSSSSKYVFANPSGKYIGNLNRPLKRIAELSGVRITLHDLRRTFATALDASGTPFGAIKQLLNHRSSSDVTERYIQHRSLDDVRLYSDRVATLIRKSMVD